MLKNTNTMVRVIVRSVFKEDSKYHPQDIKREYRRNSYKNMSEENKKKIFFFTYYKNGTESLNFW